MSTDNSKVQTELSIEETNKIRASLGLKPLKVTESSNTNGKSSNPIHAPPPPDTSVSDVIQKLKNKRESNIKIGKSIAEQLLENDDNEEDDDVSSWVQKSRKNQVDKKKQTTKSLTNQRKKDQYTTKNLQGIKVDNELTNFEDGNEHILILEDTNVLDDDSKDVLVDQRLKEKEKREKQLQEQKKKNMKYDRFNEFGEANDILNHYDDDKQQDKGFTLSESGDAIIDSKTKALQEEEVKKKLQYLASYDMDQSSSSIQSSFYTKEEMEKFKKSMASKKTSTSNGDGSTTKKKKKVMRKKTDASILDGLDATTSSDLGSRKTRGITNKEVKLQQDQQQREENYQKAVEKAAEVSKIAFSSDVFEEADDQDFYASLSNAKKANPITKPSTISDIASKVKEKANKMQQDQDQDYEDIQINPTLEFTRALNPNGFISNFTTSTNIKKEANSDDEQENEKNQNDDDDKMDMEKDGNQDDNDDNDDDDDNNVNSKLKKEKEAREFAEKEKEVAILYEEPLVSTSMSATLRLLAQKGELQPAAAVESVKKRKGINFDDEETIIEHKDEFGRVMNRKEAFVYLSQKFHGKKSGKNKQEKRQRQYQEEMKMKKMDSTDTPLQMNKTLQAYQQKSQQPYLVLSGGVNQFNLDSTQKKK
ncbi:hypothetical protein CYY_004929 [Polysphondylium violaceum]|uniref:SART-1 family protein n=1 Tax=Polysphondylium violaceum TaxID=133409 RepID=A0A8J4PV35_9MYCE|nr:hypothetical protein CYY_004929 [Polysphondylium violaceum]